MDLKQFLELFNPYPGNKYIQVTTSIDETTSALHEIVSKVDGELKVALYGENTKENSYGVDVTDIQKVENFNRAFRALPRDHDMVILKDIFTLHENPELLLRVAYTTLANAAEIVIMEKKGKLNIESTKDLLERLEFRAPNQIDILDEYDLITARKMHMWGNGL